MPTEFYGKDELIVRIQPHLSRHIRTVQAAYVNSITGKKDGLRFVGFVKITITLIATKSLKHTQRQPVIQHNRPFPAKTS